MLLQGQIYWLVLLLNLRLALALDLVLHFVIRRVLLVLLRMLLLRGFLDGESRRLGGRHRLGLLLMR